MKSTIVITGANGFIGQSLIHHLKGKYHIAALVRKPRPSTPDVTYYVWDGRTVGDWKQAFEGALAVINFAGKSVNCRYTERNKAAIYASRLESTAAVGQAIQQCTVKPKVWLNAASATIYGYSLTHANTEENGVVGEGFSVDVCRKWEAQFHEYADPEVRQVALRTTIVLGKGGGVVVPFKNLVRLGLGGRQGSGKQIFSWIHIDDFCRAVEHLITNERSEGPYNMAAPHPVTNNYLMQTFRRKMRMPVGLPQPAWLLAFGAWLIGTETELILKSRYVVPMKLQREGFQFTYPNIEECVEEVVR